LLAVAGVAEQVPGFPLPSYLAADSLGTASTYSTFSAANLWFDLTSRLKNPVNLTPGAKKQWQALFFRIKIYP
jgi:hypothetical protein